MERRAKLAGGGESPPPAEAAGYAVLPVGSGRAALELLDAGTSVDLLVSDLSMPRVDELALSREARRPPGLPAVLLPGFAMDAAELAMSGALSGAFSLLRKPIEARALAQRVAVLLEAARTGIER